MKHRLQNLVVSVEHEWLCVRSKDQKLLWHKEFSKIPMGVSIKEIVRQIDIDEEWDADEKKRSCWWLK